MRGNERSCNSWRLAFTAALVAVFAAPLAVTAQDAPAGRVVGRVIDAETGRGLAGAHLIVAGTRVAAVSGVEGRYMIANVPAGARALAVSLIGYATVLVEDVEVPPGGAVQVDVTVVPQALQMEAITVSAVADRGSVSWALNEQHNAVRVTSVVTAEQISRSPDSDAAAAVRRVSGVSVQDGRYVFVRGLGERYTTTSLNGSRIPSPEPERKMVPLDLFPAGLLHSITTAKTFTPDQPGDFSGAQVDIRTREYPTSRRLTLSLSQGYNSAVTGAALPMAPRVGGEWLAAATGPRLIPDVVRDTPRPQPGRQTNEMVNAMRNAWSVEERRGGLSSSFSASFGGSDDVLGRSVGYLVSTTYSQGDEVDFDAIRENPEGDRYEGALGRNSVLIGGLVNASTMFGGYTRVSLNGSYNRTADNEARLESGFYENHGTNIRIERLRYVERSVRSGQLQVQHQLGARQRLDWSISSARVSRQEPDRSEFVTWLDGDVPTWYNQEGAFRAYGGLTENGFEASTDYRIDLGVARSHALRVGGRYRSTTRDAFDTGYAVRSREWTPSDPRWQHSPEEFFDGRFSQNGEALFELGVFNAGGSYGAQDRIAAGYAMLEWALMPRLRFVGGARLEQWRLEVAYEDVLGNRGVAAPTNTDVLPAGSLIFDLNETQKLRFAMSRTLARPEYREIAPICYRAGLGEEQRCGNPDLRRTLIQNFDLRWEQYPSLADVFSIALFAKRFTNPIEPRYQGRSGTNSLWFQNARSALNYGIELEALRNLSFVSARLASLTAFANVTLMKSEVDTGIDGDPARRMTGQAPYVVNTGLTWASPARSTSASVLFNIVGERIINARPSGQAVQDMLEQSRPGLDLSLHFPLLRAFAGRLDLKNLLDAPYEVRQGDAIRAYYRSGRSISFGVTWQQ